MSSQALRYIPVWEAVDDLLQEQIIAYWTASGIRIRPQFLQQRIQQVALIIQDEEDNIVGLSSASTYWVPRLHGNFYVYRASLGKSIRLTSALAELTQQSFAYFNARYDSTDPQAPIGLYANFENAYLNLTRAAVIEHSGMMFVGYNHLDQQERVRYFDGAKITLKKTMAVKEWTDPR